MGQSAPSRSFAGLHAAAVAQQSAGFAADLARSADEWEEMRATYRARTMDMVDPDAAQQIAKRVRTWESESSVKAQALGWRRAVDYFLACQNAGAAWTMRALMYKLLGSLYYQNLDLTEAQ